MGLFGFLGKQFVDVIDWTESEDGVLAYRFPMTDREIQNGAKLTVRETQLALFVNEGKAADLFQPGLHTLTTQTLPILTYLNNWDKAFESPFKSDVYFFSTRQQLDQRWGTPQPVTIRDKEYGPLRIRMNGSTSYKIGDPKVFFEKVSGTREIYRTSDLDGQLRAQVITRITSELGKAEVPFVDMAANVQALSERLKGAVAADFASYGLVLETFLVQNVSLPEELQKRLDERAGMQIVGDLRQYAQFQAGQSIPIAAANEGGVAGAGAGMGAGLAMGQALMQGIGGAATSSGAPSGDSPLQTIEKLHELCKKGILSQAEFDAKKAELLKKV